MSFTSRGFSQNERAATVVFGTLLIILVTITVVSGLALMISVSQKNEMDRQSAIEAVENENLKIVTIQTTASSDSDYWDSLNFTVLNLDILDSRISAVSINGNFLLNYFLIDEDGYTVHIKNHPDYPKPFNSTNKAEIPSGKACKIFFGNIYTSEFINSPAALPDTLNLSNYPSKVYSSPLQKTEVKVYETNDNSKYLWLGTDYTVDEASQTIFIASTPNTTINTNYTVNYQTLLDPTMQVPNGEQMYIEIISDRTNIFSKRFMPPEPIVEAQLKNFGGADYLLLDGSNSIDPDPDGFITSYRWEIYDVNSNATPLYGFNITDTPLKGVKVNPSVDITNSPFKVDLEVIDNTGMVSRLSDITGKITVYPTP